MNILFFSEVVFRKDHRDFFGPCDRYLNENMTRTINASILQGEITLTASRSDGPGGQNVNKVNSKVTLKFDLLQSKILSERDKATLTRKLGSKLTQAGVLILTAQEHRSQLQNKESVLLKFDKLLGKAMEKKKVRKATVPSKRDVEERISRKKRLSEKKKWRQKPS